MENINSNNIIENNVRSEKPIDKNMTKKDTSLIRKVSFIRESVSDSGVQDRKLSTTQEATKRSSLRSQDAEMDLAEVSENLKVPKRFISTWKLACDRTKDRTKELLKRWRTLPEGNTEMLAPTANPPQSEGDNPHNWSVHVWASYIKRYPSEDDNLILDREIPETNRIDLSSVQKEKLGHFFTHLLDNDRDDLISEQDFEHLSEKLRRFADWSTNSPEFIIMSQVEHGFINTFLALHSSSEGSGKLTRDELGSFYSSLLGFTTQRVGEILDESYNALTSNGDHPITYEVYRLAFTNFLLARHPNGPGQYVFGCVSKKGVTFPIDYSALNSLPEDLEQYTHDKKSNRISIVI